MQDKYKDAHRWTEGDVLIWDNMSTVLIVVVDYRADGPRMLHRCQVLADGVLTPAARREAMKVP